MYKAEDLPFGLGVDVVPILASGLFADSLVESALNQLRVYGSMASPGFMRPEGIVVYHTAAGQYFKKTLEKDEQRKGEHK
jgi:hypothetical protein